MGVIVAIDASRINTYLDDPSLRSIRRETRILRDILMWSAHRVFTIPVGKNREDNYRIRTNYVENIASRGIDPRIICGVERELFKNARLNEARTMKANVIVDVSFRGNSLYFHLEE